MVQEQLLDQLILKSLELYLSKEELNDDVEDVVFSEEHEKKMKELFEMQK